MAYSVAEVVDLSSLQADDLSRILEAVNSIRNGLLQDLTDEAKVDLKSVVDYLYNFSSTRSDMWRVSDSVVCFIGAEFLTWSESDERDGSMLCNQNHFFIDGDDVKIVPEGVKVAGVKDVLKVSKPIPKEVEFLALYKIDDTWSIIAREAYE